ncbi:M-phase inducer phosphatase, putative [Entamoeba invadens IP1]|uniref:protein-tyrosine-phosphatase n=1 Tax=Entamoeba invadens IP1 TaxID=370355 RepID=A0A0A1U3U0_ENTIV|nr:M-phase inducer phosphatase, putative [Entamoeba invadens IP1]ELP88883.1 M-phase inducer phosphatase, putative [Entamoeba invadens IP1]|eukprot:XP_004255654.1 M-phase inducer phosphatase, putative [Entamoeba invadens IP1]
MSQRSGPITRVHKSVGHQSFSSTQSPLFNLSSERKNSVDSILVSPRYSLATESPVEYVSVVPKSPTLSLSTDSYAYSSATYMCSQTPPLSLNSTKREHQKLFGVDPKLAEKCDQIFPRVPKINKVPLIKTTHLSQLILRNTKLQYIDARYPPEFAAGHVKDAINVWNEVTLVQRFNPMRTLNDSEKSVIIIYCEFSQRRGPKVANLIREYDWNRMVETGSQEWSFPEIYLLDGGFKCIYEQIPFICEGCYTPMRSKVVFDEVRKVRATKSLSLSLGSPVNFM